MEQYYNTANLHGDYIADQNKSILKIVLGCAFIIGAAVAIYFMCKSEKHKSEADKTSKN